MYSIVYVSTAQPDLEVSDIQELFQFSKDYNDTHDITGILIYSEGNFFQVLETHNEKSNMIIDLFHRIKKDGRHYDVIKIMEKQTSPRCFDLYHTTFQTLFKSADIKQLYSFLNQEKKYNPEGYSEIAYLTQKFLALI